MGKLKYAYLQKWTITQPEGIIKIPDNKAANTTKVPVLIVNTQATTEADAIDDLDVTTAVAKVLALLPEYILAWGERKGVTSRSQDSSDVLCTSCYGCSGSLS